MGNSLEDDRRGAEPQRNSEIPLDDRLPPSPHVDEHAEGQAPPRWKRRVFGSLLVVGLAVALVAGVRYFIHAAAHEKTDDAFIDAHVVQVATKSAGYVERVAVQDNQLVNKGDLLVSIDAREVEARLANTRASLQAAQSALEEAKSHVNVLAANVEQAKADLVAAQTTADLAKRDAARYAGMDGGAASVRERDDAATSSLRAAANVISARAKVTASEAQLGNGQAGVKTAEAAVAQAQAVVRQAELDLTYTKIVASETGRVARRTVEAGNYVQVGQALMAIVPADVWIVANFKETQLTHMRPGQPVSIRIDAYPQHSYRGHVDSIQAGTGARFSLLPPENATGNYVKVVQRVPVKIVLDEKPDAALVLAPGMSVVPEVKVK